MARSATTADVFNAVAESARRDILDVLARGEAPVGEIVARSGFTQPQVSKHLKVLREVDLVRCRVDGRHHIYRVNARALKPLHRWIKQYERLWNTRYDQLDNLIAEVQKGKTS